MKKLKILVIILCIFIIPFNIYAIDQNNENYGNFDEKYNELQEEIKNKQEEVYKEMEENELNFENEKNEIINSNTKNNHKKDIMYVVSTFGLVLILPITIGVTLAFVLIQLSKYKMVRKSYTAEEYLNKDTLKQKRIRDILVATNVKETKINKN